MVRFALLGQAWQAGEAHQAEAKEHWAKHYKHVVCDVVYNLLESVRVFFDEHEGAGEDEADEGRVDCVAGEDQTHSDLGLVAVVENLGQAGKLDLILDLEQLGENDTVGDHDEKAGQTDNFQGEVVKAAHVSLNNIWN